MEGRDAYRVRAQHGQVKEDLRPGDPVQFMAVRGRGAGERNDCLPHFHHPMLIFDQN